MPANTHPKTSDRSALRRFQAPALIGALLLAACGGGGGGGDTPEATRSDTERKSALATAAPGTGQWTPLIPLSLVPAAAANLPNGKVVLWSSETRFSFSASGQTYTTIYDPVTNTAAETLVSNTGHNMFCPGTSNLPDGRLLVNGGIDSGKTSLYNPGTNTWSAGATMNIARGYEANCVLEDGSVFTLGGSWSGGSGNKHGEVWTEASGWRRLSGVPITSMLSSDPSRAFGADSHFWMFPAPNGRVFHAGPGVAMNWIATQGNGSVAPAGPRGDDQFSINGNAVMYDIGKILKTGGGPAYEGTNANANAYVIDINDGATVRKIAPMAYARVFHNSVVLPNGQVLIVGGQTYANAFTDNFAVLRPELFDPVTQTFTLMPPIAVGRNYHSAALLLPDARVMSSGGGLCGQGCAANHPDLQILSPHYLFNADGTPATRPVITAAPASATHGTSIGVSTNATIASFSIVRLSSTTHAVNNDQRRIPLTFTAGAGNTYQLAIPSNPGVVLPGYYMLFAMNADGVPSISRSIQITGSGAPKITHPGDQSGVINAGVNLPLAVSAATSYAATNLPPGLAINASTGTVSGIPTQPGRYKVTVSASNAAATTSTDLAWTITAPGSGAQFVRLEALSEINGNPWTSMAEFNLLDPSGALISRSGWTATADSVEAAGENGVAANALDGNAATFWVTQWQAASPVHPHTFTVNLGQVRTLGGFRYLPRSGGGNGTIAAWRFHTSLDGVNWTQVAEGNFLSAGNNAAEKTVLFNTSPPNRPPTLQAVANQSGIAGLATSLALSGADPDGDALSYSATGLPAGLSVNASSGLISGAPSSAGSFNVTAQVSDGRGGVASRSFAWAVAPAILAINPVLAPPVAAGTSASFTVGSNGGAGVTYRWNFGDGTPTTADSTATTAAHTYAAPGLYSVTVTATDALGRVETLVFTQAIYALPSGATRPTHSSNVVLETRAGANARVWLVNQDNNSVSVFDAVTSARIAEVAVGSSPRSVAIAPDGRIWVTNKGSASISIVSPSSLAVVQTVALPRASMPFGLAFAPNASAAYVALEASGQLLRLNVSSGATLASVSVGANPRQLAITAASDRVLVSRFVSPALPGEGTASVQTQVAGAPRGGEVVVVNAAMAVERTIVLQHSDRPDSTAQGRGLPNYLGAAVISPDGRSAWVPSKQDNVQRGSLRDGLPLDFQNSVRAITSRIDLASLAEDPAARVDHDNSGLGSAAVFHPSGAYLFVALQTSRHVAVIDPVSRSEILRFDAGRAPDGLAISADGQRLFVNNFMDRTLGVFDLTRLVNFGESFVTPVAAPTAVTTERLTAQVLNGKRLFYDARDTRLARDAYMSCASCHNDGGQDGRVWDLTGFGEGLRNTISLRGRAGLGQGFLHWSNNFDEVQDFEGQIRSLAGGTGLMSDAQFSTGTRSQPLGTTKAGVSADLDALAAYVGSLNSFDVSPMRPSAATLSAAATAGRTVFTTMNCASCHSGMAFSSSGANTLSNVGTIKASSGQRLGGPLTGIDVPTLRDVWATAPYLHDGSAATLDAAVRAHNTVTITDAELANLVAYLKEIGSEEGAAPAGSTTNLALGRTATQSSTGWGGLASRAVDGNTDGHYGANSVSHSADPNQPWWQVDLELNAAIDRIQLWNRTDCCSERLANFTVFVASTDMSGRTLAQLNADAAVLKVPVASMNGARSLTLPVGANGRYVRVQLNGVESLSLAEVQVFGSPTSAPLTNVAQGKVATQSSTGWGGLASRAVDGNTDGHYGANSVSHSADPNQPWWQVDLGSGYAIDRIQLWNRTDCCSERLANFTVFVASTDMNGRTLAQLNADPAVRKVAVASLNGAINVVLPTGATGRYVRVQLNGVNSLSLAEVQVFGSPP